MTKSAKNKNALPMTKSAKNKNVNDVNEYPLGVTTQVGSSLYIFRKKKKCDSPPPNWACKPSPSRANRLLNLIDCFFVFRVAGWRVIWYKIM